MKLYMLDRGGLLTMLSFSVAKGRETESGPEFSVYNQITLGNLRRKFTLASSWRINPMLT